MTSTIDPGSIGKVVPKRRVRSLTGTLCRLLMTPSTSNLTDPPGYFAEVDESGKEKWPRGEEKVWKAGLRVADKGRVSSACSPLRSAPHSTSPSVTYRIQYQTFLRSQNPSSIMSRLPCLVRLTTSTTSARIKLPHCPPRTTCWYVGSMFIVMNGHSLRTVELERDSACLHSQGTKTCLLPLYRVLDGPYLR